MNLINQFLNALGDIWRDMGEQSMIIFNTAFRGIVSKTKLLEEYKNLVYSCITVYAEQMGRYKPILYRELPDGTKKVVATHNFLDIIKKPANGMSKFELFEATESFMKLNGEAFWYMSVGDLTGRPKAIEAVLRPDRMGVVPDGKGGVEGYVYFRDDGVQVPLDPNEIIHFKTFNPYNKYRGLGAVQAGYLYIATEDETAEFQYNFLKNHASPSGVLTLASNISRAAFKKVRDQWRQQHGGTQNAGKTLVIRGGEAKFEKIGITLNDISLEALSNINDAKIRKIFRVPQELLGETGGAGLGRANIDAILYIFLSRSIDPEEIRFDDILTAAIQRLYGEKDLCFGHVTQIPDDEAAELNEIDKGVDRWYTRNEVRAKKGLDPVPGGDTLFVAFNMSPIGEAPQNSQKHVHKHIHNKKKIKTRLTKAQERLFSVLGKIETKSAKAFSIGMQHLLDDQEAKVLSIIDQIKLNKKKEVVFDGGNFKLEFSKDEISLTLLESLLNAFLQSGEATLESLGKPTDSFVLNQAQRDALFNMTDRFTKDFNGTTGLLIQQQVAQSHAAKETKEQLAERIRTVFADAKSYRATRIANTITHETVNTGSAEVYKQQGYRQLEWVANPGACEFCIAMDGKVVEIGQPFLQKGTTVTGSDGGEYEVSYQDVFYANLHPDCQCYLRPKQ